MQLIPNWQQILFGSWSSRLGFLATLLGALEVALPLFQDVIPRGVFAIATVAVTCLIPLVRVIQQQALQPPIENAPDPADPVVSV
jgi:hypothetical protein